MNRGPFGPGLALMAAGSVVAAVATLGGTWGAEFGLGLFVGGLALVVVVGLGEKVGAWLDVRGAWSWVAPSAVEFGEAKEWALDHSRRHGRGRLHYTFVGTRRGWSVKCEECDEVSVGGGEE